LKIEDYPYTKLSSYESEDGGTADDWQVKDAGLKARGKERQRIKK